MYSEDVVRVRNPVLDDPTTLGLVSRVFGDSDDEMQDEDSDDDVRPLTHIPLPAPPLPPLVPGVRCRV